jgi:ankyrin repeat protein
LLQGYNALAHASLRGHVDMIRCLLDHGADVSYFPDLGIPALYLASKNGFYDAVKYLYDHGAGRYTEDVRNLVDYRILMVVLQKLAAVIRGHSANTQQIEKV